MRPTPWTKVALVNLAIAVALGAFGAHGLKGKIDEQAMEWFKTGHSYHMWLGIVLLVVTLMSARAIAGWLLVAGTILFSGSLYLMAVTGMKWLGAVTPLGGALWIGTLLWLAMTKPRETAE